MELTAATAASAAANVATSKTPKTEQEQSPPKQPSPPKESAIHTRDIKMTKDDALLGDVPWTVDQHRHFVAAIFEVGLKTCSPSIIMDNMRKKPKYVTRERTKSHLQKYRITKDRNKEDFLLEYDVLLNRTEAVKKKQAQPSGKQPIPKAILSEALQGKKATKLIGGQAAALLTFSVLNNCSTDHGPDQIPFKGTKTTFPPLTEEEQQTSLGASLLYVKGLLHNMTDVLLKERHGLSNSVTKHVVKDYNSASSSEEEDYSDFEDEDSKATILSTDPHQRKPSPDVAGMSQHSQQHPSMPHPGPYGYPSAFPGSHPGPGPYPPTFQPQGGAGFSQFPPYGFNGQGPARPMAPYPQHAPPFNQGAYPRAAPMAMGNPYQQGPPHLPSFSGAAEATMQHQGLSYQYPQGHGDYYNYGQDQYPSSNSPTHPYPDDPNNGTAYPDPVDHQQESKPAERAEKRSKSRKTSSRDADRSKHKESKSRSTSSNVAREKLDKPPGKKTAEDSKERVSFDNLFASPLVADKKRRRKNQTVATELDEDRGIPGASKVTSPFHAEAEPSPITSNAKRRRIRRPNREQQYQTTPPARERTSQEPFFMESPFNEVYQAIQTENQKTPKSKTSNRVKTTPKSNNRQEMETSPDWMFAEAHLSPGEMSIASRLSHDGHQLNWEPLAIDMKEHMLDHSRASLSPGESQGSPTRASKAAFDSGRNASQKSSPDASAATSKRSFFKESSKDTRK
ncbi:MAG: hypothetical protein SGILL_005118 [Bacillariaceae sp.]